MNMFWWKKIGRRGGFCKILKENFSITFEDLSMV